MYNRQTVAEAQNKKEERKKELDEIDRIISNKIRYSYSNDNSGYVAFSIIVSVIALIVAICLKY